MAPENETSLAFVPGKDWEHDPVDEPAMLVRIRPQSFLSRAEMIRAVDLLRERIVSGAWPEFSPPSKAKRAEHAEKHLAEAEAEADD